jgi:hypothetical protein
LPNTGVTAPAAHQAGDPLAAVPGDVAADVAATHGEAHQGHLAQVEVFDQLGDVIGEGVVVVAAPRLAGTAETTAVEGDGAVAAAGQELHLRIPHVGVQRPAVAEQHGLPLPQSL